MSPAWTAVLLAAPLTAMVAVACWPRRSCRCGGTHIHRTHQTTGGNQ